MSTFPNSPRLLKGALIGVDFFNPLASVIVFQYNPEKLTRTLTARTPSGQGQASQGDAFRLSGPPEESIKLDIELDATDQLETADASATQLGLYPALSSLEMLLYPKSALVIANEVLARVGIIEIIPPEAPTVFFVWGPKRILPVRLSGFSITEEFFDPALNPIRASASLDLKVLSYHELGLASFGGAMFMAHQIAKEVMATANSAGNATRLPPVFP
jgi:hypothetical protein